MCPKFSLRFMPQEGPCFMLSWPRQCLYPNLIANASDLKRRLDVKDLELVKTTFLVSNCDGTSKVWCSPDCHDHSFEKLFTWPHSHLGQKHPSMCPHASKSLPGEPGCLQVNQEAGGASCSPQARIPQLFAYCPPDSRLLPPSELAGGHGVAFSDAQQPLLLILAVKLCLVL